MKYFPTTWKFRGNDKGKYKGYEQYVYKYIFVDKATITMFLTMFIGPS